MLRISIVAFLIISTISVLGQPGKKPAPQKQPTSQQDINKLMEEAMKNEGISKEEQEEIKKMMKGVMPALEEVNSKTADYPEFSNNNQLIPKKDVARITAINKKSLAKSEIAAYANGLYSKMLAKGDASEMAIVKKVISQTPSASAIGSAAILAMLQGHPQAALALSIKAVATNPTNLNWQNNMAALLTSYGYPEQALPVLRKLQQELPGNSTVLNNIGQSWLNLGEVDSAKRYFSFALRVNPMHHESKTGQGLVEESEGDHTKAGTTYEEAMETAPNPFIDQMLKNNKSNKGVDNLDFEKIKQNIVIYEYFPKGWMKELPALSNNVKKYNEDLGMIKGYQQMVNEMSDRTNEMINTLNAELDNLTRKTEDEFVTEMANETIKGLSFMSKPATVVLGVLSAYTTKWHKDYVDTLKKITDWKFELNKKREAQIEAINKIIYKGNNGATCEQYKGQLDKIENDYMQQVNPRLRNLLVRKTEEYRQWLNAWCTWNWYVSGNTKNVILMQDIGFAQYLLEMYSTIVTAMEVKPEHCSPPVYEVEHKIDPPQIPNFACPAVVSIPSGTDWEQLVAGAKEFNANNYQIKKTDKPMPNTSVAYGTSDMVAQPGMAPYIKTANGTIAPGNINETDDELVPLTKIPSKKPSTSTVSEPDDLVPIPYYLKDIEEIKKVREKAKSKLVKDLVTKMMQADCKGVRNSKDILKEELAKKKKQMQEEEEMKRIDEQLRKFKEERPKELVDDALWAIRKFITDNNPAHFNQNLKEMNEIIEKIAKYYPDNLQSVEDGLQVMSQLHDKIMRAKEAPQLYENIATNGLQPTISSGLQAPGTFNLPKTLFQ